MTEPITDGLTAFITARWDTIEQGVRQDDAECGTTAVSVYLIADIASKRAILAEVTAWRHVYNDEDQWHSCSQAEATWGDDRSPGSGCADDERRGQPCDCGVDRRRAVILSALAAPFDQHPDFDPAWSLQ